VYDAKHGHSYGIHDADERVEMVDVRERKRDMVDGLMDMHAGRFKNFGVELIWVKASLWGRRASRLLRKAGKGF
jgi:pyruvate/2-oxoglutarate dehydrogenase complex dihydrolipoamide dehydrogenase (E3) component